MAKKHNFRVQWKRFTVFIVSICKERRREAKENENKARKQIPQMKRNFIPSADKHQSDDDSDEGHVNAYYSPGILLIKWMAGHGHCLCNHICRLQTEIEWWEFRRTESIRRRRAKEREKSFKTNNKSDFDRNRNQIDMNLLYCVGVKYMPMFDVRIKARTLFYSSIHS